MKVKSILIKLLISILIIMTLTSITSCMKMQMNYTFADSEERVNDLMAGNDTGIIGGIINAFKTIILAPFRAMRSVNYALASSAGTTGSATEGEITPFDIFFNRFTLLDANIFSTTDRLGDPLPTDGIVYKIRTNTAIWYYAIRTLAISVIAVMLIWNLIRSISKNVSADQKAMAKNSLTDWLLSFVLLMFMHIIVIVVLNFNDVILEGIESFTEMSDTSRFFDALEDAVFAQNFVLGVASLTVYALLNWQTFKYILVYIQRFLTIVLLIMISPIIPVTYSTDRMRGGKGAALNGWLRELLFNVFLQTLHALVYAALVSVAMASLTAESITNVAALGPALIAVAAMLFVKYAEKMVKTIFGFDSSQVINTNVFANAATTIGNVATSVNNFGQRVTAGVTAKAIKSASSSIPFGQNVNAAGVAAAQNTGARGSNPIRGRGDSFINGLGGIITGRNGANGQNGQNGTANASASASASASATATATATVNDKDTTATAESDENSSATVNVFGGGGASVEEEEKDSEQDSRLKKLERSIRGTNASDEDETTPKSARESATDRSANVAGQSTDNSGNKKSEKTEKETTEKKTTETTEENHEEIETETVEKTAEGEDPEKSKDGVAATRISDEEKNELLNKFKETFKAILNDDKKALNDWASGVQEKIDSLEKELDDDTKNEIINNVNKNWNDDAKLQDYVKSLEKGSKEREYAEAINELKTYMNLDDENKSTEDKLSGLINIYNSKGLEIPKEFAKAKDESKLDTLEPVSKTEEKIETTVTTVTTGTTKTENAVKDAVPTESSSVEDKVKEETAEVETKGKGIVSLKEEAVKRAQEALLKLGVKAEDELELQSDFQVRYDETASKIGIQEPTMKDVIDSLTPAARREYRDYKSGKLELDSIRNSDAMNAIALEREADAVRRIQNEARKEGFEMNVENTEYHGTVTFNGRTETFTTNSQQGVITELRNRRTRESKNKKNLA